MASTSSLFSIHTHLPQHLQRLEILLWSTLSTAVLLLSHCLGVPLHITLPLHYMLHITPHTLYNKVYLKVSRTPCFFFAIALVLVCTFIIILVFFILSHTFAYFCVIVYHLTLYCAQCLFRSTLSTFLYILIYSGFFWST